MASLAPAATATAATDAATAATATAGPLLLLLLRLLLLLPSLSQPLPPRTPPSLPAMTSLHRSGGRGHGGGGSSGSGGGRPSSRCGAVRWGVSGGGQMRVQQRQHEALTPQYLCEWYTSRGSGGGSSGGRSAAVQLGVTSGGLPKLQRRPHKTLSPQQLREWYVQRGESRGSARCPYIIRTGDRAGQTCGTVGHTQSRCFSYLSDTWRAEFGDATELPRLLELVRQGVDIFTLDYDAIISAMYALSFSAEGDYYRCVPPDPSIAAAALGASASGTPPNIAPAEALHTFTLDLGASGCFFRDITTLTPLHAPALVRLADPSRGPVMASSSTVLSCLVVPSSSLTGLHLPSFSTNLVSTAALQDTMVTTTIPGGQRVSICTCRRTGRHLATFTRRSGSSLYTLSTGPPQVAASTQVSASGQVAASCSCRLISHQTLLWHHRLGHPSLPRLRGMHSRFLFSGLPRSLPPLPPTPAPPCLPCVEGRQRAAPHSSSFPLTTTPLKTLHMDVWGPAHVSGQGRERYFLLVVDDYSRYTTVFLLRRRRFGTDLPFLRLHSDRGGEFSSDLLQDFCRGEGILQSFTLPASPQQNRIAECRIGLVMEVARTSMIHATAPHVCLQSSTLRISSTSGPVDKLSARAIPCVFLGIVPDVPGWQFYHPTLRRVLPSKDVTFNESVPFYHLFPYHSAPPLPPPLFLAPVPPLVDPLPPQGPALLGAPPGAAFGGAASGGVGRGGAGSEGVGSRGAEPGGAEPEGVEPGGAELEGAESGGAEPRGAASSGGAGDTRAGGAAVPAGASGTGGAAATSPGGARTSGAGAAGTGGVGCAGAGDPTELGATGAGGAEAGVGGPGAGGAGAAGAGVGGTGAGGAGPAGAGAVDPDTGVPSLSGLPPPFLCPPPDQSQPSLQPASPLPAPSPYTEQSGGLTERREPTSHPVLPVRTTRRAPHLRPPPVPGTHAMALRPSSVPLRIPLPAPPESSLPEVPDPASDHACADSPIVSRLLATAVTDLSFESASAYALVAELLDFAAACRLDYGTALAAESECACPLSVKGTQWSFHRPVYGLRQTPRKWHDTLRTTIAALGFAPSTADPSLFLHTDTSLPPFYVLVYIDDLVFATADTKALTLVKLELQKRHTCTDLGEVRSYLGLQITWERARRTITLTQSHMVH
ncbi:unnamed protein product [Closterium sp. NIES-54]